MQPLTLSIDGPDKNIRRDHIRMGGTGPSGERIGLNNYFLERNGRPFFGVMGEIHFSRLDAACWEEEILKMKAGGVNVVSTYLFWNHHEESEGVFRWDGRRDVSTFLALCQQHGLYTVLRVGPFCHGEARNGGLPDWLFGQAYEVRSNDEGYLVRVRRLYGEIGRQIAGLRFCDGGTLIGIQLENEYMHAGAPLELTVGTAGGWVSAGRDGVAHMLRLKEIALEAGLEAPLYTCTGWGGAAVPEGEALALWGGYAFRPWIFYDDVKSHPATDEYIFRDYHNDQTAYPSYDPPGSREDWPYACCEMGGGMICFYPYRFTVPAESVEALSVVKIAGGCNFIGYYMFHGGTNPVGTHGAFLNEYALPKRNYDYQAPLGEFGQTRESFLRLKRLHAFLSLCGENLAPMRTVLPEGMDRVEPTDADTVRHAVRAGRDGAFLFLNNYQDHFDLPAKRGLVFQLEHGERSVRIPAEGTLDLETGVSCILPVGFDMSGIRVTSATAQPITRIEVDGEDWWFWFAPKGMEPVYALEGVAGVESVLSREGLAVMDAAMTDVAGAPHIYRPFRAYVPTQTVEDPAAHGSFVNDAGRTVHLVTLTDVQSLHLWQVNWAGRERLLLTEATVMADAEGIRLEQEAAASFRFGVFPHGDAALQAVLHKAGAQAQVESAMEGAMECAMGGASAEPASGGEASLFSWHRLDVPETMPGITLERIQNTKAVVRLDRASLNGCRDVLLRIRAIGDIGWLWAGGKLVHDCFLNGAPWDFGLRSLDAEVSELVLSILPIRQGGRILSDSPMAARSETYDSVIGEIQGVEAVPVYGAVL